MNNKPSSYNYNNNNNNNNLSINSRDCNSNSTNLASRLTGRQLELAAEATAAVALVLSRSVNSTRRSLRGNDDQHLVNDMPLVPQATSMGADVFVSEKRARIQATQKKSTHAIGRRQRQMPTTEGGLSRSTRKGESRYCSKKYTTVHFNQVNRCGSARGQAARYCHYYY